MNAELHGPDAASYASSDPVNILLLGSGGREHALLRKLVESPRAGHLWVAPGNGGMCMEAQCADIAQDSPAEVAAYVQRHDIGLVVIGPEIPLVAGVADAVRATDGPNVLEFNARFGDPETQVILPRMKADLVDVCMRCDAGTLADADISWDNGWAVSVVLASKGYPGAYECGKPIFGIEQAEQLPGVMVYHAGTTREEGHLVTSGGRVLSVTATAESFEKAREQAYRACDLITFEGKTLRRDIGARALRGCGAWEV